MTRFFVNPSNHAPASGAGVSATTELHISSKRAELGSLVPSLSPPITVLAAINNGDHRSDIPGLTQTKASTKGSFVAVVGRAPKPAFLMLHHWPHSVLIASLPARPWSMMKWAGIPCAVRKGARELA